MPVNTVGQMPWQVYLRVGETIDGTVPQAGRAVPSW